MTTTAFDSRVFRRACGQFLTGVTIVTTRDALDAPVGVTVNSFSSVSLDPPMVMVCLDKRLGSYPAFCRNPHLAIHVLPTDSAHVSTRFARRGADKFGGLAWRNGRANMPVLPEYLALFECSVIQTVDAGDHTLLLSRVDALDVRGADLLPLGFFRGEYVEVHRPMVGPAAEEKPPRRRRRVVAWLGVTSTRTIPLVLCEADGTSVSVEVAFDEVILVGYTGRDRAAVLDHIRELETLGVAPPARVPAIYTVNANLVTTDTRLAVHTADTSGEAEFFILHSPFGVLVGVGSDHTDRKQEAIDVAASKALCGKVISREVWRLALVAAHWDTLELRAWTTDAAGRNLYQSGRLDALLGVPDLLAEVEAAGIVAAHKLIFGGTLPTLGGFSFGQRFEVELRDPVLQRTLRCAYDVVLEEV